MQIRSHKPSDLSKFAASVYMQSATLMDFLDWYESYQEILSLIFWNPDVDTDLAVSGVVRDYDRLH